MDNIDKYIKVVSFLPFISTALIIFFLSSINKVELPDMGLDFTDKIIHILAYIVVGFTAFILVEAIVTLKRNPKLMIYLSLALSILYGIADEIHQSFVPGRSADFWDVVADSIGAAIGVFLTHKTYKKF
ncbi:MAG: hypothetical protein Kapaf2KO_15780 [Candidatus Kapaibacteriales bacterium]